MFGDINPLMRPLKNIASIVRKNRKPASPDNPLVALEKDFSEYVNSILNVYRDYRDLNSELLFRTIYGSDLLKTFFPPTKDEQKAIASDVDCTDPAQRAENPAECEDYDERVKDIEKGGVTEGLLRIFAAVTRTSHGLKRRYFDFSSEMIRTHKILGKLRLVEAKRILQQQGAILQADENRALAALHILLKNKDDRMEALGIARRLCAVDGKNTPEEDTMLEKIKKGLQLEK